MSVDLTRKYRIYEESGDAELERLDQEREAELLLLAKIGESRQWVPVTERLPEIGRQVDVYNANLETEDGKGERMTDLIVYQGEDCLYFDDEMCAPIEQPDITHWRYSEVDRPLPDGPGEGE